MAWFRLEEELPLREDEYDPDRELDDGRRMLEVRYDGPQRFETYYDYNWDCSEGGRVEAV